MSEYVNGLLGNLIELSLEEKRIALSIDAAHKEYTDYCADSEADLNKKIEEINKKIEKLDYYIDYARTHAHGDDLEAAVEPFDTPDGTLESIRQTIKLDSHDDPNAETLYTKATGKKLYYEAEIDRTRKLIEGSKVQAKRQYDSDVAKLNSTKEGHLDKVRRYVQSNEFSDYLKMLVYDKSAFNSPGTIKLSDDDHVTLGQRRVRLTVPMDVEQDVALNSNGEYNAAARTIGAPYYVSTKKGGTLFLEHDDRNGQYLLGGVQRLLLNFVKYFGDNLSYVLFCEPEHFSVESLGNISALGKGINPLITVPKTLEEATDKLAKFTAKAQSAPTPNMVSRILVLQEFPEKYSPDIVQKVVELCKNAEQTGSLIVLTHGFSTNMSPEESEIRSMAEVIRSRNGGFWIERLHESLFWYSAPSDISEEVRQKYVEKRRQEALKAVQEAEASAPAPAEVPAPTLEKPVEKAPEPAPVTTPAPAVEKAPEQPVAVSTPAPEEPKAPAMFDMDSEPDNSEPKDELELDSQDMSDMFASDEQPVADNINRKQDFDMSDMSEDLMSANMEEPAEEPADEQDLTAEETPADSEETAEEETPDTDMTELTENFEETEEEPQSEETAEDNAEEKDDLEHLKTDENGEPIPAHILFNVPRPKPEQKDVTMTVVSELSDQLPPPEPEPVMENPFDYVDYRPTEKLDPELTYRITDRPAAKPAPEPAPAPEPEKSRATIMSVIDAGRRKIGSFVDNRKESFARRSEQSATAQPAPEPPIENTDPAFAENNANHSYNPYSSNSAPAASAPVEEPKPEPVIETPPAEEVFEKGKRILPDIPIGKNVDGDPITLDISGGITYICGNRSDERSTIVDRVITEIIAKTHPDDVELWMFDCGEGEFTEYNDKPDEHIKYLVPDIGADTAADVADIISAEMEHRGAKFEENGYTSLDDVPADVYMPRIVVAINAFPKFSENIFGTKKYFGRNYSNRLANIFKRGLNYGIHFVLVGDKFSENGEYPACLDGCPIYSAVAVSGRDRHAHMIFSRIKMYDNEKESLKNIPAGCAFTADENSADGLTLVRISGENAVNTHTYKKVSEYSENVEEYVDKLPFIGDRRTANKFDDRRSFREEQIKAREDDECILFLGEPCRFMGEYPVRLFDDFGENILTIAPTRDKSSVALVIRAALRSLEEQGIRTEILAGRGNPVYKELIKTDDLENVSVFEGARAEDRIKDLAMSLDDGERSDTFEIILGGDLLVASMNADDMLPVLKRALVNGPRMGVHFMFVSGSIAQMEAGFLSLFRHKLVYSCPYSEAEKLLRDPNCDLPETAFRLSNDYDELTLLPYIM